MKLHEAIEEVSKFYIVGAVRFYEKMSPDPWQRACDDLDLALRDASTSGKVHDPVACSTYVERLRDLSSRYKPFANGTEEMTDMDAFILADPVRVKRWDCNRQRICIVCERKAGKITFPKPEDGKPDTVKLKVRSVIGSDTEVELICEECAET